MNSCYLKMYRRIVFFSWQNNPCLGTSEGCIQSNIWNDLSFNELLDDFM